jgi:hypothetical protein
LVTSLKPLGSLGQLEPGETVTTATPVLPPTLAVIVADPAARAVTSPEASTLATAGFELDQTAPGPAIWLPDASFKTAAYCFACPTLCTALAGLTVTIAIATFGRIVPPLPMFDSPPKTVSPVAGTWNART